LSVGAGAVHDCAPTESGRSTSTTVRHNPNHPVLQALMLASQMNHTAYGRTSTAMMASDHLPGVMRSRSDLISTARFRV